MAITFNLTSSGLTTVNFISATDFVLVDDEYVPAVATPTGDGSVPPYVVETLPIVLRGTSHDDITTSMQELAAMQKRAAEYWVDQQQANPVWFYQQMAAETGQRRALVKSIQFEFRPTIGALGLFSECTTVREYYLGTILIERHPYWERPISRIFPNTTPAAAAAVSYDYTGYGPNLVGNSGFEDPGGGGADIWAVWWEDAGDGALANETVIVHGGADAAKFTAGPSANTHIGNVITVAENQTYYFTFWSQGSGNNRGRYRVYDNSNAADIIGTTTTANVGAGYEITARLFTAPAGCTSVTIMLYCPTTNTCITYFDDVYVRLQVNDIVGDVPARVNALAIRSSESEANAITRLWMGIRSTVLHGATGVTGFKRIWELEDGTAQNGDVTKDSAGGATETNTASPGGGSGDCYIIAENLEDWDADYVHAITISASDVGYSTFSDAAGRFLWLLRARVTAGEWKVYVRDGYITARNYHEPVSVTNMQYDYHKVAVNSVPPYDVQGITISGVDHDFYIFVYAKRVSGVGNLYLDCLCPIPIDEGFAEIYDGLAATTSDTVIGEGPHEHTQALSLIDDAGGDYARDVDAYEFENFRLPPGDGRIICAYARAIRSDLTDQIEFADPGVTASIYTERWTSLRGAE